jgi:hypothetical protein
LLDGSEGIEAPPLVVTIRRAHIEGTGKEKDAGGEYRKDAKADRRCDAAKSVQYGTVTRLASLKSGRRPRF